LKANKTEAILYLFFGGLTTLVNLLIFVIFELILGKNLYLLSNLLAWSGAVAFAYVVNKLFVFQSKSTETSTLFREITEFLAARIFSFGFEELGLFLLVKLSPLGKFSFIIFKFTVTGQLISKVILAVAVVIMNYFFSKYIIFKKKLKD